MELVNLLADARSSGLTVTSVGDRLIVRGPKSSEHYATELLAHKSDILALLAAETSSPTPADGDPLSTPASVGAIALPDPNVCPRCLQQGVTSTGREGQNGSHPGQHRAFHCDTNDDHVWLVYRSGTVES